MYNLSYIEQQEQKQQEHYQKKDNIENNLKRNTATSKICGHIL